MQLAVLAAAVCALHPVAGVCLAVFAALHAAVNRSLVARRRGAVALGATALFLIVGTALGSVGLPAGAGVPWADAWRRFPSLEVFDEAFQIAWHDPIQKTDEVLATVLGPYRWSGQLARPVTACPRQRR